MATVFPELPGWTFSVTERSASVYDVVGLHERGASIALVGVDYDVLLERAREEAALMAFPLDE
jgi:hypothetical protein